MRPTYPMLLLLLWAEGTETEGRQEKFIFLHILHVYELFVLPIPLLLILKII